MRDRRKAQAAASAVCGGATAAATAAAAAGDGDDGQGSLPLKRTAGDAEGSTDGHGDRHLTQVSK